MRRPPLRFLCAPLGLAAVACAPDARDVGRVEPGLSGTADAASDAGDGADATDTTTAAASTSADEAGDGVRLDVAGGQDDNAGDEGADDTGCRKVDFLFVIDNSGSMKTKQDNLLRNFEGFVTSIRDTLDVDDFHMMVVDTDAGGAAGCTPGCEGWSAVPRADGQYFPCPVQPEQPCEAPPALVDIRTECDWTLGAGVTMPMGLNSSNRRCDFASGKRYMTSDSPNLIEEFACAAQVGTGGAGTERPIEAMLEAVSPKFTARGGCNAGFLRDDAILVVVLLNDEQDSASAPRVEANRDAIQIWHDDLLAAKHGDEEAVVVLGLLNDGMTFNFDAVCVTGPPGSFASRQMDFVDLFTNGSWASICEDQYAPFFESAVGTIESVCQDFVPPVG